MKPVAPMPPHEVVPLTAAEVSLVERCMHSPPLPMVLHCPKCGFQHVDAPGPNWDNRPHRSHLCADCGFTWRPADIETVGVPATLTRGASDDPTLPECQVVNPLSGTCNCAGHCRRGLVLP